MVTVGEGEREVGPFWIYSRYTFKHCTSIGAAGKILAISERLNLRVRGVKTGSRVNAG